MREHTVNTSNPVSIDIGGGERFVVTALSPRGRPQEFLDAIREAWLSVAEREARAHPAQEVAVDVHRRGVLPVEGRSIAVKIRQLFRVERSVPCGKCADSRAISAAAWHELRDALAPVDLPAWARPHRALPEIPDERKLDADIARSFSYRSATSYVGRHVERLQKVFCHPCVTVERQRLLAKVHELRYELEERGRRHEEESVAEMERFERDNPPYVTVMLSTAAVSSFAEEINEWIRRGYQIWGPPFTSVRGSLAQCLIREDVFREYHSLVSRAAHYEIDLRNVETARNG